MNDAVPVRDRDGAIRVRTDAAPMGGEHTHMQIGQLRGRHGAAGAARQLVRLNVDVIDAAKKQMIWEGVAVGRVTDETMENLQPKINEAVAAIFVNYPIKSASQLQ